MSAKKQWIHDLRSELAACATFLRTIRCRVFFVAVVPLLFCSNVLAESLRVGIKEAPPFSMQTVDGSWQGVSVALWEDIAQESNIETVYVAVDTVPELIESLANGSIDVAVGALTMNANREEIIDFSYPFLNAGVGIAVSSEPIGVWHLVTDIWTLNFIRAVGALAFLLCVVGLVIWLAERRTNNQFSGKNLVGGIANGFWWSAVTMTTVGYGDKAPITPIGRVLGVVWMFAGVITISGFTAAIAASFTTSSMNSKISSIADLHKADIVTLAGSSSVSLLEARHLEYQTVRDIRSGFKLLATGQADALVYDEPLLRFMLRDANYGGIVLLNQSLAKSNYAFGLRPDLQEREQINRSLLKKTDEKKWRFTKEVYMGAGESGG